jgi:tetratricopeptide (TPR) repeat protein
MNEALLLKKVGVVMHQRGDFNGSRDSFCEALKIRGELKQENGSTEILSLLNNLAEVHKCNGEYAAGLECLECVTRIYENKDEIEPVLMLTLKKSEFYVDNKEYGKAMDVATAALIMVNSQSLEYQERLLTRALITEQIAKIFEAQTKFYDAVLWHRRAHSIRSKLLPDTDELVLECIMHIADIFRKQGNFKGAKVLYKDVRNKLVEKHGVEHIAIADVLDDLGSVYSDQRNTASALNYHMKALEIRRRCKEIGDRETVGAASTMGKIATLCMQRDRILAMKYFSESLNILRQNHLCPKHPTVIQTIRAMTTFEQEEDMVKLLP